MIQIKSLFVAEAFNMTAVNLFLSLQHAAHIQVLDLPFELRQMVRDSSDLLIALTLISL